MLIVNNFADYSACAIGQVVELSELAKTYLAKYSKVLNSSQKMAFGIFIDTLDSNGVLNKITDMWIPCLSANVTEAIYNAKANEAGVITADASLLYRLNENGIYGAAWNGTDYTPDDQPIHRPDKTSLQSLFISYYVGNVNDTLGKFRGMYVFTDGGAFKWVLGSNASNNVSATPAESITTGKRIVKNINLSAIGSGQDGKFVYGTDELSVYHNGKVATLTATGNVNAFPSATILDNICIGTYNVNQYNNNNASPVAVELYAFGLTESEIAIVNNALMVFNEQFFV